MHRTPLRIGILVLGLLATAGIGYRVVQDEHALEATRRYTLATDAVAADVEQALTDLRSSLHAYVAPGQSLPFWAKRAQGTIDALRDNLKSLDAKAAASGGSLAESLDGVDQLTAAERRARTYVSRGEHELAADVIFTEIRDILAAASSQVDDARARMKADGDRRIAAVRQEQITFAAGLLAVWIAVALLLTPVPQKAATKDPAQWRNELKETLSKPIPVAPVPAVVAEGPAPVNAEVPPTFDSLDAAAPPPAPAPAAMPASVPLESVRRISEICADLSAIADPVSLDDALRRITDVLEASGLILWVASNDATTLSAVATHGFDSKVLSRIGRIPRDAANLTAAAFRENTPKISAATDTTPAALAVAMCGPSGPSGVVSIEFKTGQHVDDATVALAAIVAAQLATLASPVEDSLPEATQHRAAV